MLFIFEVGYAAIVTKKLL